MNFQEGVFILENKPKREEKAPLQIKPVSEEVGYANKMEEDQITQLVVVLDELFKPENLAGNYQLQNLLARQQFVKITDLSSFPAISELTDDPDLILEAIKQLPSRVTLNEEEKFILPQIPHHRTTLILRDLPENATLAEVKKLLSSKECGLSKEVRADVNRTWFISFANEEECMKSALWIQTKAKFRGQTIRCRIKSEHTQKHFVNSQSTQQRFVPPGGSVERPFTDPAVAYYGPSKGNVQGGYVPPNAQRMNYPPAAAMMDGLVVSDPGFVEFVNEQLRGPTYEEKNKKKPKAVKKKNKKIQEAPRNHDQKVDYDGIFKLVNKQTFELVINRFMDIFPEGPPPPEELMNTDHRFLQTDAPHFNFVVTEDEDEDTEEEN